MQHTLVNKKMSKFNTPLYRRMSIIIKARPTWMGCSNIVNTIGMNLKVCSDKLALVQEKMSFPKDT